MTESDRKAIYEWAMPDEAKRHDGFHVSPYSGRWQEWDNVKCEWWDLPPLDMNFAFDVCVPKLHQEKCDVDYCHSRYGDGYWIIWSGSHPAYSNADFYSALLAYIQGVK